MRTDAQSPSPYIRARGRREQAVRAIFGGATVIRPAVLFGLDDTFLNTLIKLMRRLPIYPMFGRGETRLQAAQDNPWPERAGRPRDLWRGDSDPTSRAVRPR